MTLLPTRPPSSPSLPDVAAAVLATDPIRRLCARGEAALAEVIGVTEQQARQCLEGLIPFTVPQVIAAALATGSAWDAVFVGVAECLPHKDIGCDVQSSAKRN